MRQETQLSSLWRVNAPVAVGVRICEAKEPECSRWTRWREWGKGEFARLPASHRLSIKSRWGKAGGLISFDSEK